jgi:hypothetical protein
MDDLLTDIFRTHPNTGDERSIAKANASFRIKCLVPIDAALTHNNQVSIKGIRVGTLLIGRFQSLRSPRVVRLPPFDDHRQFHYHAKFGLQHVIGQKGS